MCSPASAINKSPNWMNKEQDATEVGYICKMHYNSDVCQSRLVKIISRSIITTCLDGFLVPGITPNFLHVSSHLILTKTYKESTIFYNKETIAWK